MIALALLQSYYESARLEIIQRITNRDNTMFLYLAASATIFGLALSKEASQASIILIVPPLGLGAAMTHAQHNTVIGAIAQYLGTTFRQQRRESLGQAGALVDWDTSVALRRTTGIVRFRSSSAVMLLLLPQLVAVTAAFLLLQRSASNVILELLGVACIATSLAVTLSSQRTRAKGLARIEEAVRQDGEA